jgi:hypothetical protein
MADIETLTIDKRIGVINVLILFLLYSEASVRLYVLCVSLRRFYQTQFLENLHASTLTNYAFYA